MPSVPGPLTAIDTKTGTTMTVVGADLTARTGQAAVWSLTPTAAGDYVLTFTADAPYGAYVTVSVGGTQVFGKTIHSYEEEETMPAHTVDESVVTAPISTGTPTRADVTPLPNRYRMRLVNCDQTTPVGVRLRVGRGGSLAVAQSNAAAATAEAIESDFGIWEDYVDSALFVCVRSESTTVTPSVRVIQYGTA